MVKIISTRERSIGTGLVVVEGKCGSRFVNVRIGGSLALLLYLPGDDPLELRNDGNFSRGGGECGGERDPRILRGGDPRGGDLRGGDLDPLIGPGGDRNPLGDRKGERARERGESSYLLLPTIFYFT